MKYKIEKATYKNGDIRFRVFVRYFLYWQIIDYSGGELGLYRTYFDTREDALEALDLHFNKNCKVDKMEIEYIIK